MARRLLHPWRGFALRGVCSAPAARRWPGASRRWSLTRVSVACGLAAIGISFGCKGSGQKASAEQAPGLASEPVRFSFELPSSYVPVELRGEGSETLRAPAGARVTPVGNGFRVEAGPEFALEITSRAPAMSELMASVVSGRRVIDEQELLVFASGSGHALVVLRELVPEWDETERQRFACASSGALPSPSGSGAEVQGFSKSAVQNMVAACRSLALPKLE